MGKHITNYLLKVISHRTKKADIILINWRKKKIHFTTSSTKCCFMNNILSSLPIKAILHDKGRMQACYFVATVVVLVYIEASLKIIPMLLCIMGYIDLFIWTTQKNCQWIILVTALLFCPLGVELEFFNWKTTILSHVNFDALKKNSSIS